MKKNLPPKLDFESYYNSAFHERWQNLKLALVAERPHFARKNIFHIENPALQPIYHMDYASILAAECLNVKPGDHVLDLCAAPGGKSLILAEKLFTLKTSENNSLVLNEPSNDRRRRLEKVLAEYLPKTIAQRIEILSKKGELLFKTHPEQFDKILVDAPCSSEAHVLTTPSALKEWTPSRPKQLAQRQYDLLCSALSCLRAGGTLVYSTCALLPLENDLVIERILQRADKKNQTLVVEKITNSNGAEETTYGLQFLPDKPHGLGPMYFAKISKLK